MNQRKNILPVILIMLMTGISAFESRGQFLWLGFQAGEGVSWFTGTGTDSATLSEGTGTSLGLFIRYGTRPYYQVVFEWLTTNNQMQITMEPGHTVKDNVPVHNFKVPVTAGFELIHKPRFKWRIGGGVFIGTTVPLTSSAFNFSRNDFRNPQFGLLGETGILYMNFMIMVDYNYSLTRLFDVNAGKYGINLDSHLQIFALKAGLQF
jgi:hypothetical protein